MSHYFEWDSEYGKSLAGSMKNFRQTLSTEPSMFRIGVTLNNQLKKNWRSRNTLGLAMILGADAVITAQPSFPDVLHWNSIEETLTIVHEMGHLFGAIHCNDQTSIMYPEFGAMSYQFDVYNASIIRHTLLNFFKSKGEERVRMYLKALSTLRKTSLRNTMAVLEPGCSALAHSYFHSLIPDSIRVKDAINALTSDTALQLGLRGVFAYKMGKSENAIQLFRLAIQSQPDFAEVYWYLHKLLMKRGKTSEAEECIQIGRRYGIPRIEEEYFTFQ